MIECSHLNSHIYSLQCSQIKDDKLHRGRKIISKPEWQHLKINFTVEPNTENI